MYPMRYSLSTARKTGFAKRESSPATRQPRSEPEGRAEGLPCCPPRRGFKVKLTQEDKKSLEKRSMPRPEIDLLAFKSEENRIVAFEVKCFLDSPCVGLDELKEACVPTGRCKLFTCQKYRKIVLARLKLDLIGKRMATKQTHIALGLIAAKIKNDREEEVANLMKENNWEFWPPPKIKDCMKHLADLPYENDTTIIAAKLPR